MNNLFRGLIAGYGAKKLGGGCFSTIIIFLVIWYALGHCNGESSNQPRKTNVKTSSLTPVHFIGRSKQLYSAIF